MDNNKRMKEKISEICFYTACAGAIAILESLIPKPLPFIRIGLANVVLMLLIMQNKQVSAILVLLGKTVISGIMVGTLLMPTTIISSVSGFIALISMVILSKYRLGLSWVGISITAAVVHNLTQLVVVRYLLHFSKSIYDLTPIMIVLGIVSGTITGILATKIYSKLKVRLDEMG